METSFRAARGDRLFCARSAGSPTPYAPNPSGARPSPECDGRRAPRRLPTLSVVQHSSALRAVGCLPKQSAQVASSRVMALADASPSPMPPKALSARKLKALSIQPLGRRGGLALRELAIRSIRLSGGSYQEKAGPDPAIRGRGGYRRVRGVEESVSEAG